MGDSGDSANLLRYALPANQNDHQFLTRVDHRFSDNHQIYGRGWISRASVPANLDSGNIFTSAFGRTWKNTIFSVNDNYTINSRMLNNLVVTFNRTDNANFQIYPPDYRSLGITNVYNDQHAAVVLQRQRLFRHQFWRYEHVQPQRDSSSSTPSA